MYRIVIKIFVSLTLVDLSLQAFAGCPSADQRDTEVLIFGAGAAGVAAGKTLHDNGITDILILEARSDSIGGRVRKTEFAGVQVELGANWIQGVRKNGDNPGDLVNPLWTLATDPDCFDNGQTLGGIYDDFTLVAYDVDPNNASHYVDSTNVYNELDGIRESVAEKVEKYGSDLSSSPDLPDITVRKSLISNGWRRQDYIGNLTMYDLVDWFGFDFNFAESPNISSLRWALPDLTYQNFGDDDYLVTDQRGFSSILECAAKNITSKIKLGKRVTNISWTNECVCADVESASDGSISTMCGSYGIYTFSLGVLQEWVNSDPPKFNPPFPASKVAAINHNAMVYYLKVFLEFPYRFWGNTTDYILRTDSVRGRYALFQRLDNKLPGNPNVLVIHITKEEAVRIGNSTDSNISEIVKQEVTAILRQIYGQSVPEPTNVFIPTWISDPLYRGMYLNFHVGYTDEMHKELLKPEGNLYLSGEATDINYFGYYHGGYRSGERAGNDVIAKTASGGNSGAQMMAANFVMIFYFFISVILFIFYCDVEV